MKTKFSDLNINEAISLLEEIGDNATANELTTILAEHNELADTPLNQIPNSIEITNARWRGTEHTYGYIEIENDGDDYFNMQSALTIESDQSLKGKQVNIKLGSLYTINYPGFGRHNVLMHFKCKHANENNTETTLIEFEQKFKSREGEGAGNIGDFIFNGIRIPSSGLQFEVQTVNVSNDADEKALEVLDSETIKNGLDLVNASFSTLAPFTKMAQGVLGLLLSANRNKIVQQFTIGFDFSNTAADIAKLKLGTYAVVQVRKDNLKWDEWVFQRTTGLIVNKADKSIRLPFNHITFNILSKE